MDIKNMLDDAGERNLPLLQYILKISGSENSLPTEYDLKIKKLRRVIAARNIHFFEELKKILEAFNAAGIETIFLKGVMMEGIYPPGVRYFGDLDILVRMEKIHQVMEILLARDYHSCSPPLRHDAEIFQSELRYVKSNTYPIAIEPHWKLTTVPPYSWRVRTEDLWQRAEQTSINGIGTLTLSPEDSLLHFCLHFIQHKNQRWVHPACDITALIHHHKSDFDWDSFLCRVFEYKLSLPVYESLQRTSELFNPPIPSFVFDMFVTHKSGRFEKWAFDTLTAYRDEKTQNNVLRLFNLFAVPMALKFRYLSDRFFPSREFLICKYPELQGRYLVLYYMYHVWNMLVKGVKGLASLVTR